MPKGQKKLRSKTIKHIKTKNKAKKPKKENGEKDKKAK